MFLSSALRVLAASAAVLLGGYGPGGALVQAEATVGALQSFQNALGGVSTAAPSVYVRDTCTLVCMPKMCVDEVTMHGTQTRLTYVCPSTAAVVSATTIKSTIIITVTETTTITPTVTVPAPASKSPAIVSSSCAFTDEPTTTITIHSTITVYRTVSSAKPYSSTDLRSATSFPTFPRLTGTVGVFPSGYPATNASVFLPTASNGRRGLTTGKPTVNATTGVTVVRVTVAATHTSTITASVKASGNATSTHSAKGGVGHDHVFFLALFLTLMVGALIL